jgi:hypothetical protein
VAPVDGLIQQAEGASHFTPRSGKKPVADEAEDRLSRKRSKLEAALKELRDRERERSLRRFAIVGRAVLAKASREPAYKESLLAVLDAELHKSGDREIFGLSPQTETARRGRRSQLQAPLERQPEPETASAEAPPFMGVRQS